MFKLIIKSSTKIIEFPNFQNKYEAMKYGDSVIEKWTKNIGKCFSSVSNWKWPFVGTEGWKMVSTYDKNQKETRYSFKIAQMN